MGDRQDDRGRVAHFVENAQWEKSQDAPTNDGTVFSGEDYWPSFWRVGDVVERAGNFGSKLAAEAFDALLVELDRLTKFSRCRFVNSDAQPSPLTSDRGNSSSDVFEHVLAAQQLRRAVGDRRRAPTDFLLPRCIGPVI